MNRDDDPRPRRGRLDERGNDLEAAAVRAIRRLGRLGGRAGSGRIGRHHGQAARTFHAAWRGVQIGTSAGKGGSIDYIAREGDYADRQDLEHLAGDPAELRQVMEEIERTARCKRGRTAERIAVAGVIELPADSTPDARREFAELRVRYWRNKGLVAVVAIHDEPGNPHLHELVAARPVRHGADGTVTVDRSKRLLTDKAELRSERRAVAEAINHFLRPKVRFWGGRDREMEQPGLTRPPKRRVPARRWHRDGQQDQDPAMVAARRAQHEAARKQAAQDREMRNAERRAKQLAKVEQAAAAAGIPVELATRRRGRDGSERVLISRTRLAEREGEIRRTAVTAPRPLTDNQIRAVIEIHARLGVELDPRWQETAEGQSEAFGFIRGVTAAGRRKSPPEPPQVAETASRPGGRGMVRE